MKNILVVNVNWVGDVIFSTPCFRALKQAYPGARIQCLCVPRVAEVLGHCPDIDGIIVYDEKGDHRFPAGKIRIIRKLRKQHFDLTFLLHRSWTRALLVFLAGIPRRVGYDTKGRGWLLTQWVAESEDPFQHRGDYYLKALESFGIEVRDRTYALQVDPVHRQTVREMLQARGVGDGDFLAVINPGGNWDLKRWPRENYAGLIKKLKQAGVRVAITGAAKDCDLAQSLVPDESGRVIVLAGKTGFGELFALMERADILVSGDTGPLHIASSVGTPVIGLFGPTRPEVTGPRGTGMTIIRQRDVGCNRAPCYFLECPDNICMKSIGPDEIAELVLEQVKQKAKS